MEKFLNYEVNFLTEDDQLFGDSLITSIKAEFDFIRSWQGMARVFGYDARTVLDNYIALSLRKLLCDSNSLILKICPSFKMPPLTGKLYDFPGEDDDMKLFEIHTYVGIKSESEWIPLTEWLSETIAWIEKDVDSIPCAYSDRFFSLLNKKIAKRSFTNLFECEKSGKDIIWKLKDPLNNKQKVYDMLKEKGYYDLTIRTLIKHFADKKGAHLDDKRSLWIGMANYSSEIGTSAISAFATQMIYAATKQIEGLQDYFIVVPMMETVINASE